MAAPPTKFYFNGQAYNSLEEMPEEFRRYLKDENQNGMPDFVENMFGGKLAEVMKNPTFQKFAFKDKIFDKLEQLPPEQQQKVREKLEKLNAFFSTGGSSTQPNASVSTDLPLSTSSSVFSSSVPSLGGSYSPGRTRSNNVFLSLVVVIGVLLFGLVLALWLLFK